MPEPIHPQQQWAELFRKPGNKSFSTMLAGFMNQNSERLADSIAWALTGANEIQPELLEQHLPELLQVFYRHPPQGCVPQPAPDH